MGSLMGLRHNSPSSKSLERRNSGMQTKSKRVAMYGMFLAVALVVSYLESLLPLFVAVPGVKLGIANAVIMLALYQMGARQAFVLSMVRVVLAAMLFSGLFTMLYSLAGAIVSFAGMVFLKRFNTFSPIGVSVFGGVLHNIGQLVVAMLVMEQAVLVSYFPILLVSGVGAGIVVGVIAGQLNQRLSGHIV